MRRKKILKKKLLLTFVAFIFCAAIDSLLLPSSTKGSCRINDISLERESNFTKVTIYADKPFEFVHSALEKKDGKPYRVVIDCKDAIHNLPQHNFKKDLPSGTIKAIRTSQFQTEPEKIARIVLDLDKPVVYKVVEKGEDKRGGIAILTAQEPSFPFWAAAKREKASSESKLASSISLEKTAKEISGVKDILLTSSENRSRFDLKQPENAKGEEVKKRTTFKKPLCFADASETDTKSQTPTAKSETEKKKVEIKKKVSEQTGERRVLATPVTSPELSSAPNQKDEKLQSLQLEEKKVEPGMEKEASKSYSLSFSSPASLNTEKEGSSSDVQERALQRSSSRYSHKEEYVQEKPLLSQEKTEVSDDKTEKTTKEPLKESKTDSLDLPTGEEEVAFLSPEERSTREKVGSPESLMVISKPGGTALEVVPKRRIIYYHGEGKRDPFVPLTQRISTELGEISLPTFESLKLVGVLKDEAGNRALLEDERGYGYIMKNGDKIKNGWVVSVEDNKVIFQIQEYGWSKTIALELSN